MASASLAIDDRGRLGRNFRILPGYLTNYYLVDMPPIFGVSIGLAGNKEHEDQTGD